MKKIIYLLFCVVCLAACKSSNIDDPTDINSYDRPFATEIMQKIITAFDEEDSEVLMELFSEDVKQHYDIEKQIEEAMEYYKGKSMQPCEDVS